MANLLARLLQNALARNDEEADIIVAASSPVSSKKVPVALSQSDRKKIDDFLKLADSDEIDVRTRLSSYRECDATISRLGPNTLPEKRAEVLSKCTGIVCPPRQRSTEPVCSESNSYHRIVDDSHTVYPDTNDVFLQILVFVDPITPHPSGLASLTFAFANLVGLCRSYPSRENPNVNQISGRMDLYPLYGATEDDAGTVRVVEPDDIGSGLLQPDVYFEIGDRLEFLSPATSVLLVLFNRNHNSIARNLLKENQQNRWVDPTTLEEGSDQRQTQDDEIFNLAKQVNCAVFRRIVATDFLKGLLGFSPLDDPPTVDLVNAAVSPNPHGNGAEFHFLYSWHSTLSVDDDGAIIDSLSQIKRDTENVTPDMLEDFLSNYTDAVDIDRTTRPCAGLLREEGSGFDDSELAKILQGATASPALAFKPHGTSLSVRVFDIAAMERARSWKVCTFNKFREAIGLPRYTCFEEWCGNAEVAEAAKGLYTTIDSLELYPGLQGERVLDGKGFNFGETMTYALIIDVLHALCTDPAAKQDQKLEEVTEFGASMFKPSPDNGSFGSPFPEIIVDSLPDDFSHNSSYALCPFATPAKANVLLKERAVEAARDGRIMIPGPDDIEFGPPKRATTYTITDPEAARQVFNSEKFGNPLADDLTKLTDGLGRLLGFDKDNHAADGHKTISAFLSDKGAAQRYSRFLKKTIRTYISLYRQKSGHRYRVDYQKVINSTMAAFTAENLCGVTLDQPRRLTAPEFFQKLKDISDTVSGEVAPQKKFIVLKRASDGARLVRRLIENGINKATADPHDETWFEGVVNLLRELLLDEPNSHNNASHYFLARLAASGKQKEELSANVLGFAVSSIQLAKTLGSAVSFYMDGSRDDERETLMSLARQADASTDLILGYAREAGRLSQSEPTRLSALEDVVITLSTGELVEFKKGERVVVDLSVEDTELDPSRHVGRSFIPSLEWAPFQAIFALHDVKPEVGHFLSYVDPNEEVSQAATKQNGRVPWAQRAFDIALVTITFYILSFAWTATGSAIYRVNTFSCGNPTHMRPWETYTMLPGPDNRTAPFIVTLDNPMKRRLTFVDLDQRDMRFKISVNGKRKAVSSDFTLDRSVECGDRVEECLGKGFSTARVILPGGRRVVKLDWIGKDYVPGTNLIAWGPERSQRFAWKQEAC